MCLTKKNRACKNKPSDELFCRIHKSGCEKLVVIPKCCTDTTILAPIKRTSRSEIWYCCFKGKFAVYKEYKTQQPTNEYQILKSINYSENIMKIFKIGKISNRIYLISKCYEGDFSNVPIKNEILQMSHLQILSAIKKLQETDIVHGDIHAKNIFWTKTATGFLFVLGDFEFSESYKIDRYNKSYGKRIYFVKNCLSFGDTREHFLVRDKKRSNRMYKFVTSTLLLTRSIPVDYHKDLLALKRCYLGFEDFRKTTYYQTFIKSFTSFSFLTSFTTTRKELFLAEEMLKFINSTIKEI